MPSKGMTSNNLMELTGSQSAAVKSRGDGVLDAHEIRSGKDRGVGEGTNLTRSIARANALKQSWLEKAETSERWKSSEEIAQNSQLQTIRHDYSDIRHHSRHGQFVIDLR